MNDKTKKIIIIAIASFVAVLFIWATIATACAAANNRKYNQLVEQHRMELELARAETQRYRSVIEEARATNNDIGEHLQQSICSVQELGRLISEIRTRYEKMERLLYSVGDNISSVDYNNCNTTDSISD